MSPLLSVALLQPVEFMINKLLAHDPHILVSLADPDRDKTISVRCTSAPVLQISAVITQTRLLLLSAPDQSSDAEITGSRAGLIQLMLNNDPATALHHPDITLSGDVSLVQDLYRALKALDVRWDDLLAPWFGDVSTHTLRTAATQTSDTLGRAVRSLQLDLTDYLQEETALLPRRADMVEFADGVQSMRMRLDRLDARLRRLTEANAPDHL